jgi:hypothetical protein
VRDRRFVAQHREGALSRENHRQLIAWAGACARSVLPLLGADVDRRLLDALQVARDWARGEATVGAARKASLEALAVARESSAPQAQAVARSVGHAVATAHMADHALGAALYALKAVQAGGGSTARERRRQDRTLPAGVRELVLSARRQRETGRRR